MTLETEKPQGETPRLEVTEISPRVLSQFIQSQEAGLEIPQLGGPGYHDMFKALKVLPPSRQEELLVAFFTQRIENFPNGEKLGRFLAKINNIVWFKPQEEPNPEKLQQVSDEFYKRLNYHPFSLKIIRDNWAAAMDAERHVELDVWSSIVGAAGIGNLDTWWRAPWDVASDMARSLTWRVGVGGVSDARWAAAWIPYEDVIARRGYDKGNPFEVLFEGIYDKGYWFIGPVKGESVIFVPKIKRAT